MDSVRVRIVRISKALNVALIVVKAALIVLTAVTVVQIGLLFAGVRPAEDFESMLGTSQLFEMVRITADLGAMEPVFQKAIELGITALSLVVLQFYANFFRRLIARIAEGAQPFTVPNAKSLRRVAYAMLLIAVANPLLGLGLFMVTLLFSYLFEYGAYLQDRADKTSRIQEEIIVSFAEITENKSGQTGQHIRRVSEYTRILAREMGYAEADVENLRLASIMHDIGKLLVPSEILEKPARLTDEEFAEIKKHTTYGGQLLDHVEGDVMVLAREVALQHHERADGRGYPEGLRGDAISLEGRIVAVADVYDALTSRRSYKDAWDARAAHDEIVKGSGTQFDAKVVEAFERAYPQIEAVRKQYADRN